jgi:proline iminopeptidase
MRAYFIVLTLILLASTAAAGQAPPAGPGDKTKATSSSPLVEEGYFTGADGVRLFYRKVGSAKETVVYLHGGPGANFRGQNEYIEPLAHGRTIIFYDQRGSGYSEVVTDPKLLTVEHHVRDLEALRQHFGLSRMTIIGLSWGSSLASMYAAKHPEAVERMLLVSPAPLTAAYGDARDAKLDSLLDRSAIERRRELRTKLPGAGSEEAVRICRELIEINFRSYIARPTPEKFLQAARRCDIPPAAIKNRYVVEDGIYDPLGAWDFHPIIARLRMPVLILEGTDTSVPLDGTREWAATIPTARLLLIPGAGHELFLDEPEAFLKAAGQFLGGRFPKGAEVVRKPGRVGSASPASNNGMQRTRRKRFSHHQSPMRAADAWR